MQPKTPEQLQELAELKKLGAAGMLLTIEVQWIEKVDEKGQPVNQVKKWELRNQTWEKVKQFRNTVYIAGFMYPVTPNHFRVIHPMEITAVDIFRQNQFYE